MMQTATGKHDFRWLHQHRLYTAVSSCDEHLPLDDAAHTSGHVVPCGQGLANMSRSPGHIWFGMRVFALLLSLSTSMHSSVLNFCNCVEPSHTLLFTLQHQAYRAVLLSN